jgi:hypothetical protein
MESRGMKGAVILVSPAPVDGYPPVQSQARVLADAGHPVELLTQPLPDAATVKFEHPGVRITALKSIPKGLSRPVHLFLVLAQMCQFIAALSVIRARLRSASAEIAFDPNGMMISDYALFRTRRRLAHFHETVQRLGDSHLDTRLPRALRFFSRIVVADAGRAELLQKQMGLPHLPEVTPNYPLKEPAPAKTKPNARFEVIYGGSLADDQMIPLIIRSTALWPPEAVLILLGDDQRPAAQSSKAAAAGLGPDAKVVFEGWMNLDELIARYRKASLGISLLNPRIDQWVLSIGASNKRYQYMQAGLAQIGDRILGVPELLEGNGIGRCVTDYSEQAIADLVRHYVEHPAERLESGRRAEQLYSERYNYQTVFEPTLRWIQQGADL